MFSWFSIFIGLILAGLLWSILKRKRFNSRMLPPGPIGLPIIGNLHMLGDLPHRSLHLLSKKYGPIMSIRLGLVPAVIVSSPRAAELFLKTHDEVFASRPKAQVAEYLSYGNKGLVFARYGSYWRTIRKLCTLELLSSAKVEYFAPMRRDEVNELVESLRVAAEVHKIVNLSVMVQSVVENITFHMLFGNKDIGLDFKPVIQEVLRLGGLFNIVDYIPYFRALDLQGLTRSLKDTSKVIDEYLEKIINQHGEDSSKNKNKYEKSFIDVLLTLMESQEYHLDRENVKAIVLDMLGGSMDTSSTTIEWVFSELMRNPRVMKIVQDELQNVVGNKMVGERDLTKLSYLDMVVKETMRLHPVGPLLVPHESTEDIMIDGHLILKKSRILINAFAIGRDRDAWSENAEEFYPERFIGININLQGRDFQLVPFGSGRRRCPGIQMGLSVVKLVLAQLLHCFNWKLPTEMLPADLDMSEKFGLAVARANHLFLIPTSPLVIGETTY